MEEGKHEWENYFLKIYLKLRSFKISNFIYLTLLFKLYKHVDLKVF